MTAITIDNYEQVWTDGMNRGDVSIAPQMFAQNVVVHMTGIADPIRGVDAWQALLTGLLAGFPDIHFTIEEQLIVGNRVAVRWRATATHTAPFGELPATGNRIAIAGLIFDHFDDGKVVERWEQWDQSLMLQQLGVA